MLVTLPDLSSLVGRKACLFSDEQDANTTRGYPVEGRIVAVLTDDQVRLSFEEIPGVMRATTLTCKVDPKLWLNLPDKQELLGRIEQRDREW